MKRRRRMNKSRVKVSRRRFLTLTGASAAGLAVPGCSARKLGEFLELTGDVKRVPVGPEKWVTSVCGQCDGGCSIRVRTMDGRAIGMIGNRFFPLNREGLCPKGLAGLQVAYNPDRIRGPLRRRGERGQNQWDQVPWDEAIAAVAQKLGELRKQGEAHTVVFLAGETHGLMDVFISRFCKSFGTPNDVRRIPPGIELPALASYCTQGTYGSFAYDLDNTNYVLSFGAPLLDAYVSPIRMLRAYGYLRQGRPGPKAKIIQIEPRMSVTAAEADEWVPVNPGTEGALALGIAYVLIREELYDKAFVDVRGFGFEDWRDEGGRAHIGFKTLVLEQYSADEVSRVTGVPVATILRLAKEFAARQPAIALGEVSATNGLYSQMAIHALNALVGSLDVPGGVVFPRPVPFKDPPEVQLDAVAQKGVAMERVDIAAARPVPLAAHAAWALPDAIAAGSPYKVNALFLYHTNPLFSLPQPARFRQALEKVPFIVSFSPYLDESTEYADIVLPDHTYLERWQDVPVPPVGPYTLLGLRQPVIDPVHDTLHTGDALIRIAQAIKGSMAQAFPWPDFGTALREGLKGVYDAKRGSIVEEFSQKPWTALLEERGWWYPSYRTFDEFWTQLQDKGGWWDPAYSFGEWDRIFRTPSGKFEFYSLTLKRQLEAAAKGKGVGKILEALRVDARGDRAYLPHFERTRFAGQQSDYPFHLNVIKLMSLAKGRNANQPFLKETLGPHVHMRWSSWAEINPETARGLGINDGDFVWVESAVGKVRVEARLYPGAMPNVVNLPANLGHTAYGRWAKGRGVNAMDIAASERDRLAGVIASGATRVKVYKA